jgi:hypothetical protein
MRGNGAVAAPRIGGYFLLRRWTRVFFSSLRCFFFAIRLRRFLMTEPTKDPQLVTMTSRKAVSLPGFGEGPSEVLVDRVLGDPEGPADPH